MKIKTSELTGDALNFAVAKCLPDDEYLFDPHPYLPDENGQPDYFEPSTDWAYGGPILERERIPLDLVGPDDDPEWEGRIVGKSMEYGPTPLIAAMRCYVGSKLGDEVEVPEDVK